MTRDKHYTDEIWANIGPGLGPEQEYYFEPRSGYTKYIKAERYDQLKMDCMKLVEALKIMADKHDPEFDPGDYWDSGNHGDSFDEGIKFGKNIVYGSIKEALDQFKAKYP